MSEPTVTREPAGPAADRRNLMHVAGALGLIVAVGLLAAVVMSRKPPPPEAPPETDGERLKAALADADRLDPRWHFADLEADRAGVPADENAAPLVRASHKLAPADLTDKDTLAHRGLLRKGKLEKKPREGLESAGALLFEARKLAGFNRGRHDVKWNLKNPLLTELPHLTDILDVVNLLTLDAEVRAHEGDLDGSLVSLRAALVATRTIGDEPLIGSQTRRLELHFLTQWTLEECLRYGSGTEDKLLAMQSALQDEADAPVLRTVARAERATLHALMTALKNGEVTDGDKALIGARGEGLSQILLSSRFMPLESMHAALLEYTNKFVEITGLPSQEQAPRLNELAETARGAPKETMLLLGAVPVKDIGETCHKDQARLRCAAAGIALERYRLANGRWPDGLGDLAPKYLAGVPEDPFDGKPLRYTRLKGGVVVYSVGPEGKEHGRTVTLHEFENRESFDLGFRLWDAEARTRPPR